jgi:hypothetical protein
LFNSMAFPVNEFCPPDFVPNHKSAGEKHCGCQ